MYVTVDASDLLTGRRPSHLRQAPSPTLRLPRWRVSQALGTLRRAAPPAPTTPTTARSKSSRRQAGSHRRRSPIRPPLLSTSCATSTPNWCTPSRPDHCRLRRSGTPTPTSQIPTVGQLLPMPCPPATTLDGLLTLTRPRLPANGGHPITIVVADDTMFVEHPGNAGRPHATANRPTTSLHRPSSWSRTYVLASLRALQLDQHLRPGATRIKRALTTALTQETAYLCEFNSRWCQRANTQLEAHGPTPAMRSMPMRTTRPAGGSSPGGNFTSGPR